MIVRPAFAEEAEGLAEVHASAFDTPWDARSIALLLTMAGTSAFIAEASGQAQGMVMVRAVAGEAEILTLAVRPAGRRQGLGRTLMAAAITAAEAEGAEALYLEAAHDNAPALALYARCGFEQTARRARYYTRPNGAAADALVLSLILKPGAA